MKFEVRNITGEDFEEYLQDNIRITTNQHELGRSISLGIGVTF